MTLPRGRFRNGALERTVRLRPLTGADETFLHDSSADMLPAERTTALLARCVVELAGEAAIKTDDVRTLTVGDREALLLNLRRISFGNQIHYAVTCPEETCGEVMDVQVDVRTLLLKPYEHVRETYASTLWARGRTVRLAFRSPTGADQEAAARVAQTDTRAAVALVLERCVLDRGVLDDASRTSLEPFAAAVSDAMAEVDPQAELNLSLQCPRCRRRVEFSLDAGSILAEDVMDGNLDSDVHVLASRYNWSENEILGLPLPRRRHYIDLIAADARSRAR